MEKIFYTNISHFSKIEICFPEMHLGKVKKKKFDPCPISKAISIEQKTKNVSLIRSALPLS